ncbi:hypothetical protein TRICI_001134 [Trichomonascus ciferrii]|uniref:G-patch domain-containing protein n=1 Tax=Trichomonascus ciferrii TaxID=44093 RepID=A0A642VBH1_9ASCO|nr:hypothetical protein TRICI_001134 [Trichomonascus ciferrii]
MNYSKKERSNLPLRKMPVDFIKAAEPYNPSKIIYGLENLELKQEKEKEKGKEEGIENVTKGRSSEAKSFDQDLEAVEIDDDSDDMEEVAVEQVSVEKEVEEKVSETDSKMATTSEIKETLTSASKVVGSFSEEEKDGHCDEEREVNTPATVVGDSVSEKAKNIGSIETEMTMEHSKELTDVNMEVELGMDQLSVESDEDAPSFFFDTQGDESISKKGQEPKPKVVPYYQKKQEGPRLSAKSIENIRAYEKANTAEEKLIRKVEQEKPKPKPSKTKQEMPVYDSGDEEVFPMEDERLAAFDKEEMESLRKMSGWDIGGDEVHENHLPDGLSLLSYMRRITQTVYSSLGRRFKVDWTDEYGYALPEFVDEQDIYNSLITLGYTEDDITDIIRSLGGNVSDDEDPVDEDIDDYNDDENDSFLDDSSDGSTDELDHVIHQLINQDNSSSQRGKNRRDAILESYGAERTPKSTKKKNNKMPDFDAGDDELNKQLQDQWIASREARKRKKEDRELARREGRLSRQYKNSLIPSLRDIYPHHMTMDDVFEETRKFLADPGRTTVAFPPMDKNARGIVKSIGEAYNLTAKCKSDGHKFIFFTKNSNTRYDRNDSHVVAMFRGKRPFFPRVDLKGKKKRDAAAQLQPPKGKKTAGHKPKEGDIVGHKATEIGTDNIGRVMLEKMGWRRGMGLGTTNVGIVEPIPAKVKNTKWGIGKSDEPPI